jgi:Ubiquitin-conjugating enzyme
MTLPKKYNDVNQHPEIMFQSTIYNPFVDPKTGRLDVQRTYPKWDPTRHYLVTVLTFVKKIFYAKSYDDTAVANLEAKQLFQTNPSAFRTKIDECVRTSQKEVFEQQHDPTSLIKFTEDELGHRVLRDLLKANVKDPSTVSKNAIISMIDKASKV